MSTRFAPARLVTEVLADGRPAGAPPVACASLDALPAEAEADANALRRTLAAALDGLWRAELGGTLSIRVALEDPDAHVWQFVVALDAGHPDLSHLHTAFSVALPPPVDASPSLRSVLVVDDSPQHRALVTALLAGTPFAVTQAESGAEAVAMAESRAFDIILMDVQMPGMDGPTAIRTIRAAEERLGRVPARIVALTRLSASDDATEAAEAGSDECLTKPPTRSALIKAFEPDPTEPAVVETREIESAFIEPTTAEPAPVAVELATAGPVPVEPTTPAEPDVPAVDLTAPQLVALTAYQIAHALDLPVETQQERLRLLGQGLRAAATQAGLHDVGVLAGSLESAAETGLKDAVVAARTLKAWLTRVAAN